MDIFFLFFAWGVRERYCFFAMAYGKTMGARGL